MIKTSIAILFDLYNYELEVATDVITTVMQNCDCDYLKTLKMKKTEPGPQSRIQKRGFKWEGGPDNHTHAKTPLISHHKVRESCVSYVCT